MTSRLLQAAFHSSTVSTLKQHSHRLFGASSLRCLLKSMILQPGSMSVARLGQRCSSSQPTAILSAASARAVARPTGHCQHLRQRPLHMQQLQNRSFGMLSSSGGSNGNGGRGGWRRPAATGDHGGSGGQGQGPWASYLRALETSPILTKAITSAIISFLGNVVAQIFCEGRDVGTLDWRRVGIFTGLGFVYVPLVLHVWYGTLSRLVPMGGTAGAVVRMLLDQGLFAPVFISSMMSLLLAIDGKADAIPSVLRSDLPSAVKANWSLWVPAQFLNFRFVPVNLQVGFSSIVAFFWNVYLSYATRPQPTKIA